MSSLNWNNSDDSDSEAEFSGRGSRVYKSGGNMTFNFNPKGRLVLDVDLSDPVEVRDSNGRNLGILTKDLIVDSERRKYYSPNRSSTGQPSSASDTSGIKKPETPSFLASPSKEARDDHDTLAKGMSSVSLNQTPASTASSAAPNPGYSSRQNEGSDFDFHRDAIVAGPNARSKSGVSSGTVFRGKHTRAERDNARLLFEDACFPDCDLDDDE